MITNVDSLPDVLGLDLAIARSELAEARFAQTRKDTLAHRSAVADARARIDALLDMYLAAGYRRG